MTSIDRIPVSSLRQNQKRTEQYRFLTVQSPGWATPLKEACTENQLVRTAYLTTLYYTIKHRTSDRPFKTKVKRANEICSSSDNLHSELEQLNDVFDMNNYPTPFVESVYEEVMANQTTTERSDTDDKVIATTFLR